ncbi:hypothetical protein [Sporomusa sphaeroides]|uniref:Uncharacterized protein n=1 Tax=Sporomusa sphaeroides DSM 2875 TaxID=1337886 RepID=A0A1U7M9W6_9FIRM|nr:hypothetical protein [Sporomusa sphaeroides]OLS54312.1 hypothetical protein SPSPH_45580 [Sporomusa sphaeroides DSM 2875]CVK21542.1 hypothetical protein SSPH_04234 [Sporomusa sphaeroides DSM 2875]
MNDLIDIAVDHGLTIIYHKFKDPSIKGIYYPLSNNIPPVIGLDESLKDNAFLARSIIVKALKYHLVPKNDIKKACVFSTNSHPLLLATCHL